MTVTHRVVKPFARQSLHQQIVRHLGLSILRNELHPDDALLSEPELCAQLGVSRTVLREALKVLVAKGLIASRAKTGTRVRPRRDWNLLDPDVLDWLHEAGHDEGFLRDLCEIRFIVEPAAASRAAARATADEIAALEAWCRRMEMALDDNEAYIHADLEFHTTILAASHNELLQQMGSTIGAALRASRVVTTQVPGAARTAMPLHWAVVEAIRNHDEQGAEAAMSELVTRTAADIDHVLREEHKPSDT